MFILACHASGEAADVRLRSSAEVAGSIVRLSDVAEIGDGPDDAAAAEFGNLMLFPAPAAGQALSISRLEIEQLLRLSDVDLKQHTLGGAEAVDIRPGGAPADKTIVRPAHHLIPAARYARPAAEKVAAQKVAAEPLPLKPAPPPELVKRNSEVTVHSSAAGVRISTSGKALGGGAHGTVVTIELEGRERVQAKVIGPQLVQVVK